MAGPSPEWRFAHRLLAGVAVEEEEEEIGTRVYKYRPVVADHSEPQFLQIPFDIQRNLDAALSKDVTSTSPVAVPAPRTEQAISNGPSADIMSVPSPEPRTNGFFTPAGSTASTGDDVQAHIQTTLPRSLDMLLHPESAEADLSRPGKVKTLATRKQVITWVDDGRSEFSAASMSSIPFTNINSRKPTPSPKANIADLEQGFRNLTVEAPQHNVIPTSTWPRLPVPWRGNNKVTGERYLCKNGLACKGDPAEYKGDGERKKLRPGAYGGGRAAAARRKESGVGKGWGLCADCYVAIPAAAERQAARYGERWRV